MSDLSGAESFGGKDNLDFPQFVTAIARIAEEIVLKESLVATMSERLHYLCTHLETIVESKKNWRKLQKFTQRLGMVNSLIGGVKNGEGGKEEKKKQTTNMAKVKKNNIIFIINININTTTKKVKR